jgi:hypothetical protein
MNTIRKMLSGARKETVFQEMVTMNPLLVTSVYADPGHLNGGLRTRATHSVILET